jgi:hypothetical protein
MPAETFEPATQKCCSWTSLFTRGDFGAAQGLTTPVPINAMSLPMTTKIISLRMLRQQTRETNNSMILCRQQLVKVCKVSL